MHSQLGLPSPYWKEIGVGLCEESSSDTNLLRDLAPVTPLAQPASPSTIVPSGPTMLGVGVDQN